MKRTIVLIAMAIAWVAAIAQSADPHMYMRAETGTRDLFGDDGPRGVQFGAEGGVKLFKGLYLGLSMDYYTSKLNGDIWTQINTEGYNGDAWVMASPINTNYRTRSNFSGRIVVAYDVLHFIRGNRWLEFSPEIGFGFYRKSEMWYIQNNNAQPVMMSNKLKEDSGIEFTIGGRIDVRLPKSWAVGVFARYGTGNDSWPVGLAVTKTF